MPGMQRRMIDALERLPGVQSVGLVSQVPLSGGRSTEDVFTDQTADFRTANAAANVEVFKVSPNYFHAAQTSLLAGRTFGWQEDARAPRVAIVNALLARKLFGTVSNAVGRYFKIEDGTRVQVVGVAEDGRYYQLTEDPQPAVFLPFLQSNSNQMYLVVRSDRDSLQLAGEIHRSLRRLDPSLPLTILTWTQGM